MIQNLYQLNWFGKSGNSNPHFKNDWEKIVIDENDKFSEGEWNGQLKMCELPSLHIIEVYYQKINTKDEPQFTILSIKHRSQT